MKTYNWVVGSARPKLMVIISILVLCILVFVKSEWDRRKFEAKLAGTWVYESSQPFESHLVLHLSPDRKYTQEGNSARNAQKGNWYLSQFLIRNRLVLTGLENYSDYWSDGTFEVDASHQIISDQHGPRKYRKLSNDLDLPLTEDEKAIIGPWESEVTQVHNYVEHTYLYSDHHFDTQGEADGIWQLTDGKLILTSTGEDGKPFVSHLVVDREKHQLTYVPEGYSLHQAVR